MVAEFVCLHRGADHLGVSEADELNLAFFDEATKPDTDSLTGFVFLLRKSDASFELETDQKGLQLERIEANLWRVEISSLGAWVYFGLYAWHDFPSFEIDPSNRIFFVGYRGWIGKQWYDAPLAHYVGGYLASFLLSGESAKLLLPKTVEAPHEDVIPYIRTSFLSEQSRAYSMRLSLVCALKTRLALKSQESILWELKLADASTALVLVLMRMAFPDHAMGLAHLPEANPELWKRLCQNLDVACAKALASFSKPASQASLDEFATMIPNEYKRTLSDAINHQSAIIPSKLLDTLF